MLYSKATIYLNKQPYGVIVALDHIPVRIYKPLTEDPEYTYAGNYHEHRDFIRTAYSMTGDQIDLTGYIVTIYGNPTHNLDDLLYKSPKKIIEVPDMIVH